LKLSAYVVFDKIILIKTFSSEIRNGKEIIPDIPNKMLINDILIDKQTVNIKANVQNIKTNKEINLSPNTQNAFAEVNVLNVKLNKAINLNLNV